MLFYSVVVYRKLNKYFKAVYTNHIMRKILYYMLCYLLLSNMGFARTNRSINADMQQVKGNTSTMFNFCVGAGSANEGLWADWQQQLTEVQKVMHFKYIRFHGLLHDDMGCIKKTPTVNPSTTGSMLINFTIFCLV